MQRGSPLIDEGDTIDVHACDQDRSGRNVPLPTGASAPVVTMTPSGRQRADKYLQNELSEAAVRVVPPLIVVAHC